MSQLDRRVPFTDMFQFGLFLPIVSCFLAQSQCRLHKSAVQVTIYPQILSQGGRTRFETDRWNSHNGLDKELYLTGNKVVGSRTGRWIFPDFYNGIFANATEDPHRPGYPNPSYFHSPAVQQKLSSEYVMDINFYGFNHSIVMEPGGKFWPKWMNTSQHGGVFPNNLDAGADMMVLMVDAAYNYTGGQIPELFEVMNEPDSLWPYIVWDTVIQFHQMVAQKLHAKYPRLKVGGPTKTGAIENLDQTNFKLWYQMRDFMNMSLTHMDFLSFHPYNSLYSEVNTHHFTGINEARLVAVIDMLESYSHLLKGKSVPLVISEYGLGPIYLDDDTPSSLIQWAYIYLHNAHRFTYLHHRGVIEDGIAFLLSRDNGRFKNASIFNLNGTQSHVAKAYLFWKNFNSADQFLRVDSQYNAQTRMVSPSAVVDFGSSTLKVLLHNYEVVSVPVKINFDQNMVISSTAKSTCIYLDSNKSPVLSVNQTVQFIGNTVILPPESSCFFAFRTTFPQRSIVVVEEKTIYSRDLVIPVTNNIAQTRINLPNVKNLVYAKLRFAVSLTDKTAQTKPSAVSVNGYITNSLYSLYDANRNVSTTLWDVYIYPIPVTALKSGFNAINLNFPQNGGHVTTVALLVGS